MERNAIKFRLPGKPWRVTLGDCRGFAVVTADPAVCALFGVPSFRLMETSDTRIAIVVGTVDRAIQHAIDSGACPADPIPFSTELTNRRWLWEARPLVARVDIAAETITIEALP